MGVAVLLVLTAMAWVARPNRSERPGTADLSADTSGSAGDATSTTAAATATTAGQASGDGPKNLLANASFEEGSQGGARSAAPAWPGRPTPTWASGRCGSWPSPAPTDRSASPSPTSP